MKNSSLNIALKTLKMRGFSRGADTRTSSLPFLKRLMKPEMAETYRLYVSSVELPKAGNNWKPKPPIFYTTNFIFYIHCCMGKALAVLMAYNIGIKCVSMHFYKVLDNIVYRDTK